MNRRFVENYKFADMAQLVEHILGKDEVTGSTPVISSIERRGQLVAFFALINNFIVLFKSRYNNKYN